MKEQILWYILLILGVVVGMVYFLVPSQENPPVQIVPQQVVTQQLVIKGQSITVEVVDTPLAQQKGLGGRASLPPGTGMFFIFPKDDLHGIWMKDMQFGIDVLWLSLDGTVVDIAHNVAPGTYPTVFTPKVAARFVLELPAGYVAANEIVVGDKAQF